MRTFSFFIAKKILPIIFLALVISSQYYFDLEKLQRPIVPPTVLPVKAIKLANLGLNSATSALLWIYTVQEIPIKTGEFIETINKLDPRFSYPYAFAEFFLPSIRSIDQAVEIGKRGLRNADSDWRIPYYLATTYHIFLKDRKNAAFYFNMAANTPGAPEKIKSIAARYGISRTTIEQTKQIWISIYETSNDEIIIERARNNIIHIEIVEVLEKAISLYKQRYGYYPKELTDLINSKILKAIPESPLGIKFGIGTAGKITIE